MLPRHMNDLAYGDGLDDPGSVADMFVAKRATRPDSICANALLDY